MSDDFDDRPDDDRPSPMAEGMIWASEVTSIGIELVIPAVGGYFADRWLRSGPLLLILGSILGFVLMMISLMGLVNRAAKRAERSKRRRSGFKMDIDGASSEGGESSDG